MPTVQDRRSGPLTTCHVCGARGSDSRGSIDLQCQPDSCPYIDRMLKPRADHRLQGADPHGDVVDERQGADFAEDAAFLAAHQPIVVGRIEYRDAQAVTDARTLAAYAFALANGKTLAGFEFVNLSEIGARYGMWVHPPTANFADVPVLDAGELPWIIGHWLDTQARRRADAALAADVRAQPTPVRTRPRLARLWAFLTGAAS